MIYLQQITVKIG